MSAVESAGIRMRVSTAGPVQTRHYAATLDAGHSPATPEAGAIRDAAVPLPAGGVALNSRDFAQLDGAPAAWTRAHGIGYDRKRDALTGPALADGRLATMSAKLADFREYVRKLLKTRPGEKIMVFHPRVRGIGVETVANILEAIGVSVYRDPTRSVPIARARFTAATKFCSAHGTRCRRKDAACTPVQAVVVHSYIDAGALLHVLAAWNAKENARGSVLQILVASEVLEEMHTLKSTRWQLVLSLPKDIQTLRQLHGRLIRDESMAQLPPEARSATFVVFAQAISPRAPSRRVLAYAGDGWDLESWRVALAQYVPIPKAEQTLYADAPGTGVLQSAAGLSAARLGPLPFASARPAAPVDAYGTYDAYGYGRNTAARLADGARALFASRGAWMGADLRKEFTRAGTLSLEHTAASTLVATARQDAGALAWAVHAAMHSPGLTAGEPAVPSMTVVARGDLFTLAPMTAHGPALDYDNAAVVAAAVRVSWGRLDARGEVATPACRRDVAAATGAAVVVDRGVDVGWFARNVKRKYNFNVQRDAWVAACGRVAAADGARERRPAVAAMFDDYSDEFHYAMLKTLLSSGVKDAAAGALLRATYAAYGLVASAAVARKHGGSAGFHRGSVTAVGRKTAGGWTWTDYPRDTPPPRRGHGVLGVYDALPGQGGRIQFKLRKSGALSRKRDGDRRTLERGTACGSKRKEELRGVAAALRVADVPRTTDGLCAAIKLALLQKELAEPGKHFVMFNEPQRDV